MEEIELLRCYVREGSEEAFQELVRREIGLVYSAALRQVGGNSHQAEEVVQAVFTALAHKARRVAEHPSLAGWLHTSTRFAAAKILRDERRHHHRILEASRMNPPEEETQRLAEEPPDWGRMAMVVDDALNTLREPDRRALLLRFFEGRQLKAVGESLGLSEDAARMRISRALESLRTELGRRGIACTAAALTAGLSQGALVSVPTGLAGAVATAAQASVAAGGISAVAGTFFFAMNKTAIVATAAALAVGGTLVVTHELAEWSDPPTAVAPAAGAVVAPIPTVPTPAAGEARVDTRPPSRGGTVAVDPEAAAKLEEAAEGYARARMEVERMIAMATEARNQANGVATFDPNAPVPPGVDPAALGQLRTIEEGAAYFRRLEIAELLPHLRYLFTLPGSDHSKNLLIYALFQAWTERDPAGALAAAALGGGQMVQQAMNGWGRTDPAAAWASTLSPSDRQRIVNRSALIRGAVASGREAEISELVLRSPKDADGMSESYTLVAAWAPLDFPAAAAWLKRFDELNPDRTGLAAQGLGRIAAGLPVEDIARLIGEQSEKVGNTMASAAASQWVKDGDASKLGQLEQVLPTMSDSRRDTILSAVGYAAAPSEPDIALKTFLQVKDPTRRDSNLWNAALEGEGFSTPLPEKSMAFALAIGDAQRRAGAILRVYQKWSAKDPAAARAFISRPAFPADVRRGLEQVAPGE